MFKQYIARCSTLLATTAAVLLSIPAQAVNLNLSQTPLFLNPGEPPLNMLVVGRDHKLYYEAYNDYSDLNEDGTLDLKYKPTQINYYGYFDSLKCYEYSTTNLRFNPTSIAGAAKTCAGTNEWSGDFLNYLTTARIDALRKVLYGGYRSTDSATETVLERTLLPQDAHSWGKEYTSVAIDGYDIRQYTPLNLPSTAGNTTRRHFFANTTLFGTTEPLLRVLQNRTEHIWNWVSIERPVAGARMNHGGTGTVISPAPTDYSVRVAVCVSGYEESNCQQYTGGGYKPIGLLQEFGENESMYFGLITGSYLRNTSGGVLRRRMDSIANEINANGTFKTAVADAGVIASLNRLRVTGFRSNYEYACGFNAAARPINEGECQMWGNPIAEMMYESLRYFAGLGAPTSDFDIDFGAGEESQLPNGGLPVADWDNPYDSASGFPYCAKPFQTVVSDINPSYDTDQLPGTAFGGFTGDLPGLNVAALGQTIWTGEFGGAKNVFIGDVAGVTDGAPTSKSVSSFGNIRGLSPEEPTKRGGYYAASVAYHGLVNDINPTARDPQNVKTYAVALASPLPRIEIDVNGRKVTLVPFAKSVRGSGIDAAGNFQPTDQIVDFYVENLTSTSGTFRVNFEDVEQGADHDMDAIAIYRYRVVNGQVEVTVESEYAAGGITQHMGYVISGTTKDGIYLEVLDRRDGDVAFDTDYKLDTPNAFTGVPPALETGTGGWRDGVALPFTHTRTFAVSTGGTVAAEVLKDPLWYAAKWGGFTDSDGNRRPNLRTEWDSDVTGVGAGTPDNYFLVTNALKLSEQLREAFKAILGEAAAASSASVNSGSISTETLIYQATFETGNWSGDLKAKRVDPATGAVRTASTWEAARELPAAADRKIITVNSDNTGVPFLWDSLDDTRRRQINDDAALSSADRTALQQKLINYLRGSGNDEGADNLRVRGASKIGDIVNSAPVFVGAPRARYSDNMPGTSPYSQFMAEQSNRNAMIYVGANDGMLHGFDAGGLIPDGADTDNDPDEDPNGGREIFAFIPQTVFGNLKRLPEQNYTHTYFVDGSPNTNDVYFGSDWHTVLVGGLNLGGQGIYALDITDPARLAQAQTGTNADSIYLWEFSDQNDRDLGFTYSQPAIVRLQNGSWAAVFGNGYNNTVDDGPTTTSATGNAVLYIVDIATGALIKKFDTRVGSSDPRAGGKPNGLATPTMVDVDGDRIVDHAYAGDLLGNMWKFDLRSSDDDEWGFAFGTTAAPQPLFSATDRLGNAQPITVRAEVARGPFGVGVMVLFGTGKFLENSDKLVDNGNPKVQAFYGLVDNNTYTAADQISRGDLQEQTVTSEVNVPDPDGEDGPGVARRIRTTTQASAGAGGYYLTLQSPVNGYEGERQITDPLVRGDRVIFTTLIPTQMTCGAGGASWLMVLDLLSGGRLTEAQLDTNGDGKVDENDTSASGIGRADEIMARPASLLCLTNDCDTDRLLASGSKGELQEEALRSIGAVQGRQSWRQIR
jgi:type IV pilus assembly protein PilY1